MGVGTESMNSDLLGTTRIKKSAAHEIVSAAAAQSTVGKGLLKMPLIESNAATVNKSGARKTPTICSAIGQTGDPATVSIQNNPYNN